MSALVAPLAIDPGLAIYLPVTVRVTADQEPGQHVLAHRLGWSGMVHGGEQPERRLGLWVQDGRPGRRVDVAPMLTLADDSGGEQDSLEGPDLPGTPLDGGPVVLEPKRPHATIGHPFSGDL